MPVFNSQTGRWERDAPYTYDWGAANAASQQDVWDNYVAVPDVEAWVAQGNDPDWARKAAMGGLRRGVDAQGRPWQDFTNVSGLGGRAFEYLSPTQYQGMSAMPQDDSPWYRSAPQWNQDKGEWHTPLNKTNLMNAFTLAAITGGGANAYMAGSAVPGVATTAAPAGGTSAIPGTGGLGFADAFPGLAQSTAGPSLGRKALSWLSSDEANALGKVADYYLTRRGDKAADVITAQDKAKADQRYQDMLDLVAQQRAEDLQLDAEREAALQARWKAEQDQRQAIWDAREAQMEPYRVAGQQSLARIANLQLPTRTPYRSRFMA
jgi:hypothetical protein